jgi:hypothetical protein
MCCFVVWLTVFVGARLFVGPRRHGLNGTGVALPGRPSNSTVATHVFVNCAFGHGRYTRRKTIARSSTPLLLVRLGVGTRNRSRVVEVLDVVEELGTGCEGLLAFGAFVIIG